MNQAQPPIRMLFICVENANRSQMAQAFARIHGGRQVEAYSAGSRPAAHVNPKAIEAMREVGYNLTSHTPTSVNEIPNVEFDFVATMGCGDACPAVPARFREDWQIPDPKHMEPEEFRQVRDLIEQNVIAALQTVGTKPKVNLNRLAAEAETQSTKRLFTFASGGWVLLLTGLVCLGLIAWALGPAILRQFNRPPGDNVTIESYAFDVSNLSVPRRLVVPAMLHRDMVPVMTNPTASDVATMQGVNDPKYSKYLVPSDLVIGVEIKGESRAYPISVMYVHEIINDELGGVPIAVTHHWPCDSVVVFDRRVNGQTLEFRVSGLVYNSNMLMYDAASESLWSQLLGRAVSGPKAGATLAVLPAELQRWDQWLARHPQTTVLNRDLRLAKRYKDAAPLEYQRNERVLFPVDPSPPPELGLSAKTRVLAVEANGVRRVYPLPDLAQHARQSATSPPSWTDLLGPVTLRFIFDGAYQTVRVEHDPVDAAVRAIPVYWFAWHAMHPEDELAAAAP